MSQQSLFDDKTLDEHKRDHPELVGREALPHDADTEETSDVADYIRRKDRQEMKERQERNTLHQQATKQIGIEGKLYCLLWALESRENHPDLDEEMRRAAHGVKNRMDSLLHAKQQDTEPGDPDHIGLGEAWPYDDDVAPKWNTKPQDYQRHLVGTWFTNWRHIIPTEVLDEAIEQSDMPHL